MFRKAFLPLERSLDPRPSWESTYMYVQLVSANNVS